MKIFLASDHTGFAIKEKVKTYLQEHGYTVEDCGAYVQDASDDYPEFMHKAAEEVSKNPQESRGILFGGSGQGEAIVANKSKDVRCALFYKPAVPYQAVNIEGTKSDDPYAILKLTREHNDANMLSFGIRFLSEEEILTALTLWLETSGPSNDRHIRRINQIKLLEK